MLVVHQEMSTYLGTYACNLLRHSYCLSLQPHVVLFLTKSISSCGDESEYHQLLGILVNEQSAVTHSPLLIIHDDMLPILSSAMLMFMQW